MILHRWKLTVAFAVILWLATTSAGLCTATSDALKSLRRPRLHQAAGNVEEMRHRLEYDETSSCSSDTALTLFSISVSHSPFATLCVSFAIFHSLPLYHLRLIRCVSFRVSSSYHPLLVYPILCLFL